MEFKRLYVAKYNFYEDSYIQYSVEMSLPEAKAFLYTKRVDSPDDRWAILGILDEDNS